MKRRSFLTGLLTAGTLPHMPALAFAKVGTSAAALSHLKSAQIIVRSHNVCSVPMLKRLLRVEEGLAAEIQAMLIDKGVVSAKGAAGVLQASNPYNLDVFLPQSTARQNFGQKIAKVVKDKLNDRLEAEQDLLLDKSAKPETRADERQNSVPSSHTKP